MDYTPENINIPAFEDALKDHRDYQHWQLRIAQEKAQAYFAGYEQAIEDVRSMLHCANYEKRG